MRDRIVHLEVRPAALAAHPSRASSFLSWVFAAVGIIAPLALVACAFVFEPDCAARTQFLVDGFRAVVGLLLAVSAIGYVLVQPDRADRRAPDLQTA